MNLYRYCGNNGVNSVDPYGTIAIADDAAFFVLVAATCIIASTDWKAVGEAIGDAVDGIITKTKNILEHAKYRPPTPSGSWPPAESDLGITTPGDPAQWPKFSNKKQIKRWIAALIALDIAQEVLDPYMQELIRRLKELAEKEKTNGA